MSLCVPFQDTTDRHSRNISFQKWNITDYDENGNRIEYTLNGYGQIANVTEFYNDPFIYINESYVTSYRYDTNGNLVKITDSQGNEFKFGYDSLNRKVSMDDPDLGHWIYKYDQNGNLIFQSGGGGNLVSGDGYYREYDGNGHLLKVRQGNVSTSALLEEYLYDQDGQRIKIKRNDSANTIVYTPFKELMRVVNNTGSYDFTYIYQDGALVARKNPDGTTNYYHTDHLGSTSVLTDANGRMLENTTYTPYGEELSGGDKEVRGYTGQFDDEATGQMYYGGRYYVPGPGQFVQPDPIILNIYNPQNWNRYSYVLNNPYRYTDPNGWWAVQLGGSGSAGLGELFPLAYIGETGVAIAYDPKIKNLQIGGYETHGPGVLIGSPGISASGIVSISPDAKNIKDLQDKSSSVGGEISLFGYVAGGSFSYPEGVVKDFTNPTTISGSFGGGFKESASVYTTSTNAATLISIKLSNANRNTQAINVNSAGSGSTKTINSENNPARIVANRFQETIKKVANSIKTIFRRSPR